MIAGDGFNIGHGHSLLIFPRKTRPWAARGMAMRPPHLMASEGAMLALSVRNAFDLHNG
jgi:hypothetical protein